ncbi:unnamed protein product [Vitrella brassicaformis CCMP3155]|uniref:Transmembrane protein n=1 Tax=Vitrella brassicaformis (strain CCMP3155) TaxID=1169540 RepID=A0A0G4FLD6_VITBC|nr:unnamed protein product [Vitrella brassicaformis CCMP3155]|eukprot:CEM14578.1 unnamed protein product [Vitrella brassicaformis CCMP3155]
MDTGGFGRLARIASSERQATKPFIVAWWLSLFSLFVLAASHCYLGVYLRITLAETVFGLLTLAWGLISAKVRSHIGMNRFIAMVFVNMVCVGIWAMSIHYAFGHHTLVRFKFQRGHPAMVPTGPTHAPLWYSVLSLSVASSVSLVMNHILMLPFAFVLMRRFRESPYCPTYILEAARRDLATALEQEQQAWNAMDEAVIDEEKSHQLSLAVTHTCGSTATSTNSIGIGEAQACTLSLISTPSTSFFAADSPRRASTELTPSSLGGVSSVEQDECRRFVQHYERSVDEIVASGRLPRTIDGVEATTEEAFETERVVVSFPPCESEEAQLQDDTDSNGNDIPTISVAPPTESDLALPRLPAAISLSIHSLHSTFTPPPAQWPRCTVLMSPVGSVLSDTDDSSPAPPHHGDFPTAVDKTAMGSAGCVGVEHHQQQIARERGNSSSSSGRLGGLANTLRQWGVMDGDEDDDDHVYDGDVPCPSPPSHAAAAAAVVDHVCGYGCGGGPTRGHGAGLAHSTQQVLSVGAGAGAGGR